MGHYASEIDSEGWQEGIYRTQRLLEMRRRLADIPLGQFTVSELEAVMRVMGLAYNGAGTLEPTKEHYEILEKKLSGAKQPR